jgi:energy-coupling factor transport system ATP-binding protein
MKILCRDLSYSYDGPRGVRALDGVSFGAGPGEKIAVIGPAGSGKTTLIQLLDALVLPTGGDILYDGESVGPLAKARRLTAVRRRIGLLFQFPEHQFFHETAYDELTFSLRNFFSVSEEEIEERAREIMAGFGMDVGFLKQVSPFVLSSGEKRKLALASALLSSPEVLILDEPTAGMDASGRRELVRIISGLSDTTVFIVTHNLEDFLPLVGRVLALSRSRLVADLDRGRLEGALDTLEKAGITPPLVLSVRKWLREGGIPLDEGVYDMEALLALLEAHGPHRGANGTAR